VRWRAVGRGAARASVTAVITGAAGVLSLWRWHAAAAPEHWWLVAGVTLAGVSVASLLWLTHLVNVAHTPVTFKIANGELLVTRPFLFWRRRRRMATSSVRGVRVSATPAGITTRPPTGRLSIRRRNRLPLRVPGHRPLVEINRVAEELRAVLGV
jgi:hypothetical protein